MSKADVVAAALAEPLSPEPGGGAEGGAGGWGWGGKGPRDAGRRETQSDAVGQRDAVGRVMVEDGLVRMQRCRAGRVGVMVDDTFSELFGDTSVAAVLDAGSVALGGAVLHRVFFSFRDFD